MKKSLLRGVFWVALAILIGPSFIGEAPAKEKKKPEAGVQYVKGQETLVQLFAYVAPIVVGKNRIELLPITCFVAIVNEDDMPKVCGDIPGARDIFVSYFNEHPLQFVNEKPDFDNAVGPLTDAMRTAFDSAGIKAVRLLQGAPRSGLDFQKSNILVCAPVVEGKEKGKKPEGGGDKKEKKGGGEGGEKKPKHH